MSDGDWLAKGSVDTDEVRDYYNRWAGEYDGDLAAWDYRAPRRMAQLLIDAGLPSDRAVLDAGCGTGLAGRALRDAGFTGSITGIDVSDESIAIAGEAGIYDAVRVADLADRLPFEADVFGTVMCVGVLTYVAALDECWREFCRVTGAEGLIGFTQREDLWDERACVETIDRLAHDGLWIPVTITEPEPYLPETDGELATVGVRYVVARTT